MTYVPTLCLSPNGFKRFGISEYLIQSNYVRFSVSNIWLYIYIYIHIYIYIYILYVYIYIYIYIYYDYYMIITWLLYDIICMYHIHLHPAISCWVASFKWPVGGPPLPWAAAATWSTCHLASAPSTPDGKNEKFMGRKEWDPKPMTDPCMLYLETFTISIPQSC